MGDAMPKSCAKWVKLRELQSYTMVFRDVRDSFHLKAMVAVELEHAGGAQKPRGLVPLEAGGAACEVIGCAMHWSLVVCPRCDLEAQNAIAGGCGLPKGSWHMHMGTLFCDFICFRRQQRVANNKISL